MVRRAEKGRPFRSPRRGIRGQVAVPEFQAPGGSPTASNRTELMRLGGGRPRRSPETPVFAVSGRFPDSSHTGANGMASHPPPPDRQISTESQGKDKAA